MEVFDKGMRAHLMFRCVNVYKNCFRIRITAEGSEYVEEFFEAPGVGSLKSESKRANGRWILTLREFKKPESDR